MPDFMGGLAKGIEKSKGMVAKAIEGVSQDMIISPNVSGMENIAGMQPSEQSSTGIIELWGLNVKTDVESKKTSPDRA